MNYADRIWKNFPGLKERLLTKEIVHGTLYLVDLYWYPKQVVQLYS